MFPSMTLDVAVLTRCRYPSLFSKLLELLLDGVPESDARVVAEVRGFLDSRKCCGEPFMSRRVQDMVDEIEDVRAKVAATVLFVRTWGGLKRRNSTIREENLHGWMRSHSDPMKGAKSTKVSQSTDSFLQQIKRNHLRVGKRRQVEPRRKFMVRKKLKKLARMGTASRKSRGSSKGGYHMFCKTVNLQGTTLATRSQAMSKAWQALDEATRNTFNRMQAAENDRLSLDDKLENEAREQHCQYTPLGVGDDETPVRADVFADFIGRVDKNSAAASIDAKYNRTLGARDVDQCDLLKVSGGRYAIWRWFLI
jgi:hypothetical protein